MNSYVQKIFIQIYDANESRKMQINEKIPSPNEDLLKHNSFG